MSWINGIFYVYARLLFVLCIIAALFCLGCYLIGDGRDTQSFFFTAVSCLFLAFALNMVRGTGRPRLTDQQSLWCVLSFWTVLPIFLGLPLFWSGHAAQAGYFEAVSAVTTTGASILAAGNELSDALLLWRSFCAWLGGLLMFSVAIAFFAPQRLGGFEIGLLNTALAANLRLIRFSSVQWEPSSQIRRFFEAITDFAPPYLAMTGLAALVMAALGVDTNTAVRLAMESISTTAFSLNIPVEGLGARASFVLEGILLVLMTFGALSVVTHAEMLRGRVRTIELKYLLRIAAIVSAVLFLRYGLQSQSDPARTLEQHLGALWGIIFTNVSFLTTTGLTSSYWQGDMGLLAFVGLAFIGGGVASTAGGGKLLRLVVMFKHCGWEMRHLIDQSLIRPLSVLGKKAEASAVRSVWLFTMLYVMAFALCGILLSLLGLNFKDAFFGAASAMTTTGSLTQMPQVTQQLPQFTSMGQFVYLLFLVVARMEVLVLIAMLRFRLR